MNRPKTLIPKNLLKDALPEWQRLGGRIKGAEEAIGIIAGGYRVAPEAPLIIRDEDFPRLEGPKLVSTLRTVGGLLEAKKMLGPFRRGEYAHKHLQAAFLVEKEGKLDKEGQQAYRFIINGSQECLLSDEEAKAVRAWVASKDPALIERWLQMEGGKKILATLCKNEIGLKSTLNDHLEHVPIKFVTPKTVIRGLNEHGCKYVGKADLEKGFRQIILSEDSFPHIVVKMYFRGSEDSPWTECYVVDTTAVMGLKKSPPYFEKVVGLFVNILIVHFPEIFLAKNLAETEKAFEKRFGSEWDPKTVARVLVEELMVRVQEEGSPIGPREKDLLLRLVWNYLDDLMFGAPGRKMAQVQMFVIVFLGAKLGLVFNENKLDFPEEIQVLLGVLLDTGKRVVSLKPGFVKKLLVLIEDTLKAVSTGSPKAVKLADSLKGKLVFSACTLLPRLNALCVSLSHYVTAMKAEGRAEPGLRRADDVEIKALEGLFRVGGVNGPQVPLVRYLGLYKGEKTPSFTDARGWERGGVGGAMGGLWIPNQPRRKRAPYLVWRTTWPILRNRLLRHEPGLVLQQRPTIAYLEFIASVVHLFFLAEVREKEKLKEKCLLLLLDNTNAVSWHNKGYMRYSPYNNLCLALLAYELTYNCQVKVGWISTERNVVADALTREYVRASVITLKRREYAIKDIPDKVIKVLGRFLRDPTGTLRKWKLWEQFTPKEVRLFHLFRLESNWCTFGQGPLAIHG